jgi:cell shape-determining protein MreC
MMRQLKFKHVFASLMVISFICAFVFPRQTRPAAPLLQVLFAPVARPVAALGNALRGRFDKKTVEDNRPDEDIREENERLRAELIYQSSQLELLKKINADRASLGSIRDLCTPVAVVGSDSSGLRQTLDVGPIAGGAQANQAVLYGDGVAGKIVDVGIAGARVRLITDGRSAVTGTFCRYERGEGGELTLRKIPTTPAVLEGTGSNRMVVQNLYLTEIESAKIQVGDWVTLADPNFPEPVQGYMLGKVVSIRSLAKNALYAELQVEPQGALARLREVMVMNRSSIGQASAK